MLTNTMYNNNSFSPDGNYVMVSTIEKPFSYLVPFQRFPSKNTIYDSEAKEVETVLEVPLIEDLPQGFMAVRMGRRSLSWRFDKPSSLVFAEALDGGDPENETAYRDEVKQLNAPFNGTPVSLIKTINRYAGIQWGNDEVAVATDYWWNSRNTKVYLFNPADAGQEAEILYDLNYQDHYSDPGNLVTEKNQWGSSVISMNKGHAYLMILHLS